MNLLRIDGYSQQIILGVVIIAAIFPDDRASEEMAKKMEESLPLAINCDMGEGFGLYHMGDDERMMPHITVASVVMHNTVQVAKRFGVRVGAPPSLPDLQGFGRREMKVGRDELRDILLYQIGALTAFLKAEGMTLNHAAPRGSLNGMAARQDKTAHAIADAAEVFGVPVYDMAGGIGFVPESYADLDYAGNGTRIITREHEAVEPMAAAAPCLRAIREGKIESIDGNDVPVRVESICVHSDTPGAVSVAKPVRSALADYLGKSA
jgi:UPF0271 protein